MPNKKNFKKSTKTAEKLEFKGFLSFLILHELSKTALYGEQLAQRIGARRGDKLTPGTIYPALKNLRKENLVSFTQDGQKKVYSLTNDGKKELGRLYRLLGKYFKGLRSKVPPLRKPNKRKTKIKTAGSKKNG